MPYVAASLESIGETPRRCFGGNAPEVAQGTTRVLEADVGRGIEQPGAAFHLYFPNQVGLNRCAST